MKPFLLGCVLAWTIGTSVPTLYAEDELLNQLAIFEKDFTDATSPKDSGSGSANQAKRSSFGFATHLKILTEAITDGEFGAAQTTLRQLDAYVSDMTPDLQKRWMELTHSLNTEVEKRKASLAEQWRTQVDQLVIDVHDTCLRAKSASELDALLVRCVGLQMRKKPAEDLVGQRTVRKLDGAVTTLQQWSEFLDFSGAKNFNLANSVLRNLTADPSHFPVLTVPEIQSRLVPINNTSPNNAPPSLRDVFQHVYDDVKDVNGISAALDRLDTVLGDKSIPQRQWIEAEKNRLELLKRASESTTNGKMDQALTDLEEISTFNTSPESVTYFVPLRANVTRAILVQKFKTISTVPISAESSFVESFQSVLGELRTKGDWATMIQLIKIYDSSGTTTRQDVVTYRDAVAIGQFVAGQRFEKAGDLVSAITEYRAVITAGGKIAPAQEAEERLKQINEKDPQLLSSPATALLEIQKLRQEVNRLNALMTPAPTAPNSSIGR